ncbi:hypothetical protein EDC04DRAFT_2612232 [Pisolithus marmoratus]|nr:hypothetical protein EDC04DRAFT_2612232 [Pisolithus marmoratus]
MHSRQASLWELIVACRILDGETLCVHGGLSPDIRTLDQVCALSRAQEIPMKSHFWYALSLPPWNRLVAVSTDYTQPSKLYATSSQFNSLTLITCSHQLVQEGYIYMFVLALREGGEHDFKVFGPVSNNEKDKDIVRKNYRPYFCHMYYPPRPRQDESCEWNVY